MKNLRKTLEDLALVIGLAAAIMGILVVATLASRDFSKFDGKVEVSVYKDGGYALTVSFDLGLAEYRQALISPPLEEVRYHGSFMDYLAGRRLAWYQIRGDEVFRSLSDCERESFICPTEEKPIARLPPREAEILRRGREAVARAAEKLVTPS